VLKSVTLTALLCASALSAQPQLGAANLNAGWLWPKGVYALAIHDGPGPRTPEIATFLAASGKVADFFQTICHYAGQPWRDYRSAMCLQQYTSLASSLNHLLQRHQCVGNHGQDHLVTPALNQADTIYQIGNPTWFLEDYWERQNCPALLTFPGFQADGQHTGWLNQDAATAGRQQGPIGADFTGDGYISTDTGPVYVGSDQDCLAKGHGLGPCVGLMLDAMKQADHGGIINIHDYNPYSLNTSDPFDLKSGYAYDYLVGVIEGCQAANGGAPCVWLTPDAIPGVHRNVSVGQFSLLSDGSDDFSDRIAAVLVEDINGDSTPDAILPRKDGLYCAINIGGKLLPLRLCLSFSDSNMLATQYWMVDVEGDRLPYLVWLNSAGMVGVKSDGRGGFSSEIRLLAPAFAETRVRSAIYQDSIRFSPLRAGSALPDLVAMSSSGVVIAANNGHGFGLPQLVPQLTHREDNTTWTPERAGKSMVLADLDGVGAPDIVVLGTTKLLCASAVKNGFSGFQPLTTRDGFNYWSSTHFFNALSATRIDGRTAVAGWTPVGIAFSNFLPVEQRLVVDQFKVMCSDCFLSLPGWQDQFQQSNRTAVPDQAGFADFKTSGTPQAYVVWGKGLYAGDVNLLAGYR